ncbi:MAG: hypothetical protein ACYTDX_05255 [Planctomycetota bacterium]
MKVPMLVAGLALAAAVSVSQASQTPPTLVDSYDSLADAILAVKKTERSLVASILVEHRDRAKAAFEAGDAEAASAQMALFANEGDNAVGGVRKRLLEGGHHHNADGEAKGIYDPGFVIVTRKAKATALEASGAMRTAGDDAGRSAAWKAFEAAADSVMGGE